MAIDTGLKRDELLAMARKCGVDSKIVPTGKDGKIMKDDIIIPIREHNLIKRYGALDKVPEHLQLILQLNSPMLASRIDSLKKEQQDEIWKDDNWDFEEKLNGVRNYIINDGNGVKLYSRHNSDVDLLPIEFSDKILFPDNCDLSKLNKKFIIDDEMTSDVANLNTVIGKYGVETESILQAVVSILSSDVQRAKMIQQRENVRFAFNSFDCIYYDGQWLLNEPLSERRKLAEEIITALESCGFKIRRVARCSKSSEKRNFYKSFVTNGKEGCVAKLLDSKYNADNTRGFKHGWIKIKKSVQESMQMDEDVFGDTVDAYISGYLPGNKGTVLENYVGVVCVSVNLRKTDGSMVEHEIGRFSGFPMALREEMTEVINGEPTLRPSFYRRVVEIDGLGVSSRERRLQHCQFLGFRYDKSADACIMEEEFLNSQIQ